MALLVVVSTAALLGIWVVAPLMRRSPTEEASYDPEVDALMDEKNSLLRSIIDLEADARVGKVSSEDALLMRGENEIAAAQIIRKLDNLEGSTGDAAGANGTSEDLSAALEEEIALARERLNKRNA